MKSINQQLELDSSNKEFAPSAVYYSEMDFLLYLNQDCSYRADRVDAYLTLLWHPYEDKVVGIRLKGFLRLAQKIKDILKKDNADRIEIATILELLIFAVKNDIAEGLLDELQVNRLKEREKQRKEQYERAIKFANEEKILAPSL